MNFSSDPRIMIVSSGITASQWFPSMRMSLCNRFMLYTFPRARRRTIDSLPDEILLEIFEHYRRATAELYSPTTISTHPEKISIDPLFWWFKLEQVCHRWRRIIQASPGRLALQLHYSRGIDVNRMLQRATPAYFLAVRFPKDSHFRKLDLPGLKLVLMYPERFREAILHPSLMAFVHLVNAMLCPAPRLERLELAVEETGKSALSELLLPPKFLGENAPSLTVVRLGRFIIRDTPRWLSTATNIVSLTLHHMAISQEALRVAFQGTSRLEVLDVQHLTLLDSTGPDRSAANRAQLRVLRSFLFMGLGSVLEILASMIEAQPYVTNFYTVQRDNDFVDVLHTSRLFSSSPDQPVHLRLSASDASLRVAGPEESLWVPYLISSSSPYDPLPLAASMCNAFSDRLWKATHVQLRLAGMPDIHEFDQPGLANWRRVLAPFANLTDLGIEVVRAMMVGRLLNHRTEGGLLHGCLPKLQRIFVAYDQELSPRTTQQLNGLDAYVAERKRSNYAVVVNWENT
ncbi:hypothetical protein BC834DRAFT_434968 [Gloeopeniophorella convolvens]|nr:hypothetical protein BC834DRAFT_434968 [Gloeopeniophorella convolvens]